MTAAIEERARLLRGVWPLGDGAARAQLGKLDLSVLRAPHMQLRCSCVRPAVALLLLLALHGARALAQPSVDAGSEAGTDSASLARETARFDPDAASADASAMTSAAADVSTTPPRLLLSPAPVFPAEKLASGEHPTVVLKVTVFADGSLGDVVIEHSAGPSFDEAASQAVRGWTFAPARRGELPIASRVGVAVHFELPELGVHEVTALTADSRAVPHRHAGQLDAKASAAPESELVARAELSGPLRSELRGPSDFRVDPELLRATPSQDGAALLKRAPGVVVAPIEGDAVAPHLMLRGFDADHGQDIALNVDGVPLNQPSHIHGQGYADLGSIIPETVRNLRVTEGVYDSRQGDFAVAGSADFELGVERRGLTFAAGYGSFHSFRALALYAPPGFSTDTFGAVVFKKTSGFGQNREATQGSGVAQLGFDVKRLHFTLHGSLHASRAQTANVLRRDDIEAGRVGFYDVYPLASAEAQGASAARGQFSLRARYRGERGANGELVLYFVQNAFRLQANYTGFAQSSLTNESWAGRGDLIEQQNQERSTGLVARYRAAELRPFSWARAFLEVGVNGRFAQIEQRQGLLEAPGNLSWDERIDARIAGLQVGGFVEADLTLVSRVHLRGGLRAELLSYQIDDRLANSGSSVPPEDHLPGYRRSALGLALGPRVVLSVDTWPGLTLVAAYGEGYRSPMALALDDGDAPFTKVRSADVGLKYVLGPSLARGAARFDSPGRLELRGSAYFTRLGDDLVFEADEGRVSSVGPSTRTGFVLYGLARPLPWALLALSATYVHATLQDPPAASAEDPTPVFREGEPLPNVPPVVLRGDLMLSHRLVGIAGHDLGGRLGVGYTYWSARPLAFGASSTPVSLLDAELSATYRAFTLSLSCSNLLDLEYAALELSYPSSWDPGGFVSRVPARHVMAGAPRTLFATLGITL